MVSQGKLVKREKAHEWVKLIIQVMVRTGKREKKLELKSRDHCGWKVRGGWAKEKVWKTVSRWSERTTRFNKALLNARRIGWVGGRYVTRWCCENTSASSRDWHLKRLSLPWLQRTYTLGSKLICLAFTWVHTQSSAALSPAIRLTSLEGALSDPKWSAPARCSHSLHHLVTFLPPTRPTMCSLRADPRLLSQQ